MYLCIRAFFFFIYTDKLLFLIKNTYKKVVINLLLSKDGIAITADDILFYKLRSREKI